jgi:hypothetical protein
LNARLSTAEQKASAVTVEDTEPQSATETMDIATPDPPDTPNESPAAAPSSNDSASADGVEDDKAVDSAKTSPPTSALSADGKLQIKGFALNPAGADKRYAYRFTVGRTDKDKGSDSVSGSIWIAVNGLLEGAPKRLPLRQVSDQDASFIRMRFKQLQIVEGNLHLPSGFSPKNMIVEAKPTDDRYTAVSMTFPWKVN